MLHSVGVIRVGVDITVRMGVPISGMIIIPCNVKVTGGTHRDIRPCACGIAQARPSDY